MYLGSLDGDGSWEGRLETVGVDSSLSPLEGMRDTVGVVDCIVDRLSSCPPWITVSSPELSEVVLGVDFGVLKLDLIPALSLLARFWRALFVLFCSGAGVLCAGPCGVVRVDGIGCLDLGDGPKLKVRGLKLIGVGCLNGGCGVY